MRNMNRTALRAAEAVAALTEWGQRREAARLARRMPLDGADVPESTAARYVGRSALLREGRGKVFARVQCVAVKRAQVGRGVLVQVQPVDGGRAHWVRADRLRMAPDLVGALLDVAEGFGCPSREMHATPCRVNVAAYRAHNPQAAAYLDGLRRAELAQVNA
jgi:hypothetical protein